jgi:hypothetical protein
MRPFFHFSSSSLFLQFFVRSINNIRATVETIQPVLLHILKRLAAYICELAVLKTHTQRAMSARTEGKIFSLPF